MKELSLLAAKYMRKAIAVQGSGDEGAAKFYTRAAHLVTYLQTPNIGSGMLPVGGTDADR